MEEQEKVIKRHVHLMKQTGQTLGHIVASIDQEIATTYQDANDGPKGWTVLEVLAHLRDFDEIFRNRAQMMLDETNPHLPGFDHKAMAIEQTYNEQDLADVYAQLAESREQTRSFFKNLSEAQWQRSGIHPERGPFTMLDAVMQVGLHDITHLEQIARILAERKIIR